MSETEMFTGRRYEIVAFAKGQKPIYYEEFQGLGQKHPKWLLVTIDASSVSIYSEKYTFSSNYLDRFTDEFGIGRYLFSVKPEFQSDFEQGVISKDLHWEFVRRKFSPHNFTITTKVEGSTWQIENGIFNVIRQHDALDIYLGRYDDTFDVGRWDDTVMNPHITREQAISFTDHLGHVVAVFPIDTMRRICEERALPDVLPGWIASWFPPPTVLAKAIMTAVKLEMGWPLVSEDILEWENQDRRFRTLQVFDWEHLVEARPEATISPVPQTWLRSTASALVVLALASMIGLPLWGTFAWNLPVLLAVFSCGLAFVISIAIVVASFKDDISEPVNVRLQDGVIQSSSDISKYVSQLKIMVGNTLETYTAKASVVAQFREGDAVVFAYDYTNKSIVKIRRVTAIPINS